MVDVTYFHTFSHQTFIYNIAVCMLLRWICKHWWDYDLLCRRVPGTQLQVKNIPSHVSKDAVEHLLRSFGSMLRCELGRPIVYCRSFQSLSTFIYWNHKNWTIGLPSPSPSAWRKWCCIIARFRPAMSSTILTVLHCSSALSVETVTVILSSDRCIRTTDFDNWICFLKISQLKVCCVDELPFNSYQF